MQKYALLDTSVVLDLSARFRRTSLTEEGDVQEEISVQKDPQQKPHAHWENTATELDLQIQSVTVKPDTIVTAGLKDRTLKVREVTFVLMDTTAQRAAQLLFHVRKGPIGMLKGVLYFQTVLNVLKDWSVIQKQLLTQPQMSVKRDSIGPKDKKREVQPLTHVLLVTNVHLDPKLQSNVS